MVNPRRYLVHFLVAKDEDQYSALCYEFTTVGCGPDAETALQDVAISTVEYLEHLIRDGRANEADRPAPPELLLEFLDLPVDGEARSEQLQAALTRVIIAQAVLERAVQIEYNLAARRFASDPRFAPTLTPPGDFVTYPAELVFAGE